MTTRDQSFTTDAPVFSYGTSVEAWRDVPAYGGRYQVSDQGRVRTVAARPIARHDDGRGYLSVGLYRDGVRSNEKVHRLVCQAFHAEGYFDGAHVAHLDGDPKNCRADNLAWVTPTENQAHRRMHGTAGIGEANSRSKLTASQVQNIRARKAGGERAADLAAEYGISQSQAFRICAGEQWQNLPVPVSAFGNGQAQERGL